MTLELLALVFEGNWISSLHKHKIWMHGSRNLQQGYLNLRQEFLLPLLLAFIADPKGLLRDLLRDGT